MKSCIEWRKGFKYLPQIDEFNIDYKNKEIKLYQFLEQYAKTQRVNIRLPLSYTKDDIDLLESAYHDKHYNIAIVLKDAYYTNELREHGTPFYFYEPCYDWDQFRANTSLGVSDVFISGTLGFELDKVSEVAKRNNVKIRCYANIAQAWNKQGNGFKDFYIRPEDVDFYSQYVDVIEFFDSIDKQNVLYEIYFKDKEWNGNLREIIKGMTLDINNYYILGSEFARRRSQCGKKCLKDQKCELCDRLIDLAKSLEDSKDYQVFKRR